MFNSQVIFRCHMDAGLPHALCKEQLHMPVHQPHQTHVFELSMALGKLLMSHFHLKHV